MNPKVKGRFFDINCDLGECEPRAKTRRLLRWVTSANIACGGHAGDARTLRAVLRLCRECGVHPGAHPGFADRTHFGREELPISAGGLEELLEGQVGDFVRMAEAEKMAVAHVKLHGALYHVVERSQRLAAAYVEFMKTRLPQARIFCAPAGAVIDAAKARNLEAWGEFFADRGYLPTGRLIPRNRPGAVISDLEAIRLRLAAFLQLGTLPASKIPCRTICVHSDSPGAVRIARLIAEAVAGLPSD